MAKTTKSTAKTAPKAKAKSRKASPAAKTAPAAPATAPAAKTTDDAAKAREAVKRGGNVLGIFTGATYFDATHKGKALRVVVSRVHMADFRAVKLAASLAFDCKPGEVKTSSARRGRYDDAETAVKALRADGGGILIGLAPAVENDKRPTVDGSKDAGRFALIVSTVDGPAKPTDAPALPAPAEK